MKSIKDRLYVATFSKDALRVARENQLNIEADHTCMSYLLDEENQAQLKAEIKNDLEEAKCEKVIFHGPFTEIHPAAIDHRIVSAGMKRLEEAFSVVKEFGCNRMVVHSGYIPFIYIKEWQVEKSISFWQEFMKDKPADFNIYVENVLEDEPYMMADMMKGIEDPRIKLCLDVGHANALTKEVSIYRWVEVLGPFIGHFHLHNNYGDGDTHQEIGQGSIDFDRLFAVIEEFCSKDVTFTIESRDCEQSVKWLKERGYI